MSTFTVYTYYYILLPILYSTGVLFIVCYCFYCFNKGFGCFFCQYLVTSSHLNAKTIRIVRRSGHQRQTNRCNVTPVTSLCWSGLYQRLHQHLRIEFGAFFPSFWLDFDAHPTVAQNLHAKASFCQKPMRTLPGTERNKRTRLAFFVRRGINLGGDQSRRGCGNARKRVGGGGKCAFTPPLKK